MKNLLQILKIQMPFSFAILGLLIVACNAGSTVERPDISLTPSSTQTQKPSGNPPTSATANSAAAASQPAITNGPVFIQLTDPLDEPEFYCVDVPGAGRGVRLDSDLQAHTCKPISEAEDELFTLNHPNEGQIFMEAYGLCVEAELAIDGASLRLQPCSDSPLQFFVLENDSVRLISQGLFGLCWAVAPGIGTPTGGPSHLRRDLTLEKCDTIEPALSSWSVGLFDY